MALPALSSSPSAPIAVFLTYLTQLASPLSPAVTIALPWFLLGTPENLSLSLEGMTLTPTTDFVGTVTLTLAADDQGNSGTGGSLTDNGEVQIYHAPTNDAPVLTASATQTLNEDGTLTLSSVLQISDDAEVDAVLKIEAIATNGTLKLAGRQLWSHRHPAWLCRHARVLWYHRADDALPYIAELRWRCMIFSADRPRRGWCWGSMIGSATLPITVTPVNDAPTISSRWCHHYFPTDGSKPC